MAYLGKVLIGEYHILQQMRRTLLLAQSLGRSSMSAGRRRQWWNVVEGAKLADEYWRHECGYLVISVVKNSRCSGCGISEEEYGRLKSKGSKGRVSST